VVDGGALVDVVAGAVVVDVVAVVVVVVSVGVVAVGVVVVPVVSVVVAVVVAVVVVSVVVVTGGESAAARPAQKSAVAAQTAAAPTTRARRLTRPILPDVPVLRRGRDLDRLAAALGGAV
jgi:hypothetical protein